VHGNYSVREALINQGYKLKDERIICDKNRFYEAIYVSKSADQPLIETGSPMWNWADPVHQDYWHRTVGHYRQKAKNDPVQFQPIVERYQLLRDSISHNQQAIIT
jgi:tRNA A22 N-methylase